MYNLILLLLVNPCRAEVNYLLENYFYYSNRTVADSTVNTGNQLFGLPSQDLAADIRGELKWRGEKDQMVIRPRYQAEKKVVVVKGEATEKNESDWNITDAFWETQLTPEFSMTTGLQVYQWGPAELINPSNPLFHFNSKQKSFGYKEKGKVLIRGNYTVARNDSVVLMLEPISNNESPWLEGDFVPKALIKYEHLAEGSSSQIGVVAGQEEKSSRFFGLYGNYQFSDALSIYTDLKTTEEPFGYSPRQSGAFWNLAERESENKWAVLAVTGLRWEGDYDVRLEYVYNSAGYSEEEWTGVLNSISNPFNPDYLSNLSKFQNPGLELPGKHYLYFSYRINEPFEKKDLNLYLRDMYSLQDYSSQCQFEFDKAVTDAVILFGNVTAAFGRKDAEFKLLNSWQSLVGLKWVL